MAVDVGTLVATLEADTRAFEQGMDRAERQIRDVEDASGRAASGGLDRFKGAMIAVGGALALREVGQFARQTLDAAVAAEEAASAFATTFGPAVGGVSTFVSEFANQAGFAEHELQQLLAVSGNIVQGLGATESESAELAQAMATLSGDVASFTNAAGGAPAVLGALQSALTGEREALKTYGIVISEAEVQERALQDTQKDSVDQLTRLERAQATLALAVERAGKANGDLERTQDSAANTQRRLNAMWQEAQVTIGQALMPVLERLLPVIENLIPAVAEAAVAFADAMVPAINAVIPIIETAVPILEAIGGVLEDLTDPMQAIRDVGMEETLDDMVDQLMDLEPELAGYTDAMVDLMEGTEDSFEANEEWNTTAYEMQRAAIETALALQQNEDAADDLADATSDATAAYDDARQAAQDLYWAEQELTQSRLDALNPVRNLISAERDRQEALAEVARLEGEGMTGTQEHTDAVLDAIIATGDYQLALEAIDTGSAIGALNRLGDEAGFTQDELDPLVTTLRELRDMEFPPHTLTYIIEVTGGSGGEVGPGFVEVAPGIVLGDEPRGGGPAGDMSRGGGRMPLPGAKQPPGKIKDFIGEGIDAIVVGEFGKIIKEVFEGEGVDMIRFPEIIEQALVKPIDNLGTFETGAGQTAEAIRTLNQVLNTTRRITSGPLTKAIRSLNRALQTTATQANQAATATQSYGQALTIVVEGSVLAEKELLRLVSTAQSAGQQRGTYRR